MVSETNERSGLYPQIIISNSRRVQLTLSKIRRAARELLTLEGSLLKELPLILQNEIPVVFSKVTP
jgi:hypothetical protein